MSRMCREFDFVYKFWGENSGNYFVTSKISEDSLYRCYNIAMETGKKNNRKHCLMTTKVLAKIKVLGSLRSRQKKTEFFLILM